MQNCGLLPHDGMPDTVTNLARCWLPVKTSSDRHVCTMAKEAREEGF